MRAQCRHRVMLTSNPRGIKEFPKPSKKSLYFNWGDAQSLTMYHFPHKYEDEQKKERKRARRRRRKEMMLKQCRKAEQCHQATFPVLVERTKASPSSRHRTRIYLSPEFSASYSAAFDSAENSDNEEYYSTRAKLPAPNSVGESTHGHQTRSRKKKKAIKYEEEINHSLYPSYFDTPPSRNGMTFALDAPCNRSMDHLPARKSMENMYGIDPPENKMRFRKPNKLPPIDKENRSNTDEYPGFGLKRFWNMVSLNCNSIKSWQWSFVKWRIINRIKSKWFCSFFEWNNVKCIHINSAVLH